MTGSIVGTPHYMSPEQVQGQPVDGRSDQFSLAVIAFEMLTGEKPYTGEHLTTVVYKIVAEEPPLPHRINASLGSGIEERPAQGPVQEAGCALRHLRGVHRSPGTGLRRQQRLAEPAARRQPQRTHGSGQATGAGGCCPPAGGRAAPSSPPQGPPSAPPARRLSSVPGGHSDGCRITGHGGVGGQTDVASQRYRLGGKTSPFRAIARPAGARGHFTGCHSIDRRSTGVRPRPRRNLPPKTSRAPCRRRRPTPLRRRWPTKSLPSRTPRRHRPPRTRRVERRRPAGQRRLAWRPGRSP